MADPRFFAVAGPFTLAQLAGIAQAELAPGADAGRTFVDVGPLQTAGPSHFSFLDNRQYLPEFEKSAAGGCVVAPELAARAPQGMALLLSKEPYRAYARIATAFYPPPRPAAGIAPSAVVDPTAKLGEGCRVEAGVVIGARVEIGRNCVIGANTVIAAGVVIGDDCAIGPLCSISHALLGSRIVLLPGVRIGQDGFGFAMGPQGHIKVPQLGRVIIEDDVEIGANSTIDRGAGPDTVVGAGTKIDNLVQIGHNVRIGRHCVLVSQVGVSGSTRLGNFVALGGQAGLAGHLTVGDGARIAGSSAVAADVPAGETWGGMPAKAFKQYLREQYTLEKLAKKGRDEREK